MKKYITTQASVKVHYKSKDRIIYENQNFLDISQKNLCEPWILANILNFFSLFLSKLLINCYIYNILSCSRNHFLIKHIFHTKSC